MIYKVYMEFLDSKRVSHRHCVLDCLGNEIAVGDDQGSDTTLDLHFNGKTYHFPKKLISIQKPKYAFPYPFSPDIQKTFGVGVICDEKPVLQYYREAATYKKVLFLKHNFVFNVYQYEGRVYHCYKVGFAGEHSHYYCLKTTQGETVAIIERNSRAEADRRRGTIYLKNDELLKLVLLVCASEIMMIQLDVGDASRVHDPSAGNYISVSEAEKEMFDKDFIPMIKAREGITD